MSDEEKRGFSGFGNLLSDVDTDAILKHVPHKPLMDSGNRQSVGDDGFKVRNYFGSRAKWIFGIFAALFIIVILFDQISLTQNHNPSASSNYSTTETSKAALARVAPEDEWTAEEIVPNPSVQDVPQLAPQNNAAPQQDAILSIGPKTASFDCTEAKSTVEILICSDQELSILDGQVGEAYGVAKGLAKDEATGGKLLLDQQRDFLKGRSVECSIPFQKTLYNEDSRQIINCLKGVYQTRLTALEGQIAEIRTTLGIEDVDGQTKQTIYNGANQFFEVMNVQGVAGVQGTINNCYAGREPGMSLMQCMAFDSVASAVIPEIERKHNLPMTADFENSVYQGRMRKALADAGVSSDPYEQANIIKGIEGEAAVALDIIVKETVQSEAVDAE